LNCGQAAVPWDQDGPQVQSKAMIYSADFIDLTKVINGLTPVAKTKRTRHSSGPFVV
jgi:hypothetical protein